MLNFIDTLRIISYINKNRIELSGDDLLKDETAKHSKSYSDLLKIYVASVKMNVIIKGICKVFFFIGTMGSLIAIIYLFYKSLNYVFDSFALVENLNEVSIEAILSMVTVLVPAISSLIVAFIKLPEIIAKYLFNNDEDNYMNLIIKNIQDYDTGVYERDYKIKELLYNNKTVSEESKDQDIPDLPEDIAG